MTCAKGIVRQPPLDVRAKALCLTLFAIAPWPMAAIAGRTDLVSWASCAGCSLLACFLLFRLLEPLRRVANEIRQLAASDPGEADIDMSRDDLAVISDGLAHLRRRLDSLRHRWIGRHGLTALPVREALRLRDAGGLQQSSASALVGAIRFADYGRLAAFDPETAEIALTAFADRLAAAIAPGRPDGACRSRQLRDLVSAGRSQRRRGMELQAICYAMGAEIEAGALSLTPEIEVGTALYPDDARDAAGLLNHALVSIARPDAEAADHEPPGPIGACRPRAVRARAGSSPRDRSPAARDGVPADRRSVARR